VEEMRNRQTILIGKREERRPLIRLGLKFENNFNKLRETRRMLLETSRLGLSPTVQKLNVP
jgi:hypothetical protein